MPDSPQPKRESPFVCDCGMRPACNGEPFYKEHKGKQYCVLHYPDKDKIAAFQTAYRKKLDKKDFDFRGVWFPEEIALTNFVFDKDVDFSHATFSAAVSFNKAVFKNQVTFWKAVFDSDVSM